jgi:hypothetical protein
MRIKPHIDNTHRKDIFDTSEMILGLVAAAVAFLVAPFTASLIWFDISATVIFMFVVLFLVTIPFGAIIILYLVYSDKDRNKRKGIIKEECC